MNGDPLIDVALHVADGDSVDWDDAGRQLSAADRAALDRLRQLQRVAHVHVSATEEPAVHESIRANAGAGATAPTKWGALEIIEKIGRGAYGDVYRARDTRLGREVALKLHRYRDLTPEADIVREGQLLARVNHPNVVTVYGAERIDGRTGIWMELLRGETLEQELRRRGPFSAGELVLVAINLCDAIQAVHGAGLLHRDIKAQNVIRTDDGRLVLMDFGTGSEGDSGERSLAGTPAYLAPELLAGGGPTVAIDVYALGVLLFHLATGLFPVDGHDLQSLKQAHRQPRSKSVATLRPDLPPRICDAIDRAVAPDASVRFPNVRAFRKALPPPPSRRLSAPQTITIAATVLSIALLTAAAFLSRSANHVARSKAGVTLSQLPLSIQQRFNIRAPTWEGFSATCTPHGPGAVALCNLADGSVVNVRTPASNRERSPLAHLSPDGRLVAYMWLVDQKSPSIRLIGADGSSDRELIAANGSLRFVVGWNRGSEKVLFVNRDAQRECVEEIHIESGARQQVHCEPSPLFLGYMSLSADDRYLAFAKARDPIGLVGDIWVLDRLTGNIRAAMADAAVDLSALWTPDDSAIAFVSNRLGTWGLFTIDVDNGVPQGSPELVRDLGRSMPVLLGFARDGTLFFRTMADLEDILRARIDPSGSALLGPERAHPTAVDEGMKSPDWSPDGARFAYIAGQFRGEARIVIHRANGEVEKELAMPGTPSVLWTVRWSPDGRMLAATSNSPDRPLSIKRLDLVNPQDGLRRTIGDIDGINDFRWAPDGRAIYFTARNAVHSVDLANGSVREIYRTEPPWGLEQLSTFDVTRDGTAFVLPVRAKEPRVPCAARVVTIAGEVRDLPPFPAGCRALAWSHDEQAVLAGIYGDDGAIPLFRVDLHGSEAPVRLKSPRIQIVDISTDPNGRELLLGVGNPRPDVWTVSGFAAAAKR